MFILKEKIMKNKKLKNNDFLIGLDFDHANNEQKIALLNQIIDNELEKPENDVDMSLVEECMAFIDDIDCGRFAKNEEALNVRLQKIIYATEPKKLPAPPKKPTVNYRRIVRTVGGCAAALVLIVTSLTVAARMNGYGNAIDWVVAMSSPADQPKLPTEIIFLHKGDETIEYNSIEELLHTENLNVMYPSALPRNTKIESVRLTNYEEGQFDLAFTFNNADISFSVCNFDLSSHIITDENALTFTTGGHTFTIITRDGKFQANYVNDEYAYRLTCDNYEKLLDIIEHLRGLE